MHSISYISLLISLNCIIAISLSRCTSFFFSAPYVIPKSRLPHCIFVTSTRLTVRSCHLPSMECMSSRVKNCLLVDRSIGQYILAFTSFSMIYCHIFEISTKSQYVKDP